MNDDFNGVVTLTDDEFAKIEKAIIDNSISEPTEAAKRGAKLLRKLYASSNKMVNESYTVAQRWPLLAANCPDALDELEAHWRKALESGAHVEGDWRNLGLVGNERHRFDHAQNWARGGNEDDLLGQTGRGLMVGQLRIEAKRKK